MAIRTMPAEAAGRQQEQGTRSPLALLTALFEAELSLPADVTHPRDDAYLGDHAMPNTLARKASVFERYLPYAPRHGTILDWGCNHAPDACLLRAALGDDVSIHGCDFKAPGLFPVFHSYAQLEYRQLEDPVALPYEDGSFDLVVGGGVLEHTAFDGESLKELHRIIRTDGMLVITFLPNRLSWTETLNRARGQHAHERNYRLREARSLMLHHGFLPIRWGYHQMLPSKRAQGLMQHAWPLNGPLEHAWPLNMLATNLIVIAKRRLAMM